MRRLVSCLPAGFRDHYRSNWRTLQSELKVIAGKLSRQFSRPPFPGSTKTNLHLGCGSIYHSSFINIDGFPAPHIHYIRAIDNLSIFADETVDFIYASHCLEHFSYSKIPDVLREWFRVLKKGGKLRLSVPDFDLLLKIYRDTSHDLCSIEGCLLGAQNRKLNFHHSTFNKSHLSHHLRNSGFLDIYEWHPGVDELTVSNDYSNFKIELNGSHYPISLNLEAKK